MPLIQRIFADLIRLIRIFRVISVSIFMLNRIVVDEHFASFSACSGSKGTLNRVVKEDLKKSFPLHCLKYQPLTIVR